MRTTDGVTWAAMSAMEVVDGALTPPSEPLVSVSARATAGVVTGAGSVSAIEIGTATAAAAVADTAATARY